MIKEEMNRVGEMNTSKNPHLFSNEKTKALDLAFQKLHHALQEYLKANTISERQVTEVEQLLISSYLELKASYLLMDQSTVLNKKLNNMINSILNNNLIEHTIVKSNISYNSHKYTIDYE